MLYWPELFLHRPAPQWSAGSCSVMLGSWWEEAVSSWLYAPDSGLKPLWRWDHRININADQCTVYCSVQEARLDVKPNKKLEPVLLYCPLLEVTNNYKRLVLILYYTNTLLKKWKRTLFNQSTESSQFNFWNINRNCFRCGGHWHPVFH